MYFIRDVTAVWGRVHELTMHHVEALNHLLSNAHGDCCSTSKVRMARLKEQVLSLRGDGHMRGENPCS